MVTGIIKKASIAKNKDGDKNRLLLQVELMPDDVRIVEMINQAGEDTYPANGCRILVLNAGGFLAGIAVTDDLTPETEAGEKELYSTNSPATNKLARLKLNKNSEIILNQGTDYGVKFNELKTAFDQLKKDHDDFIAQKYNLHTHPTAATGPPSVTATTGVASTADISPAKVTKVRI